MTSKMSISFTIHPVLVICLLFHCIVRIHCTVGSTVKNQARPICCTTDEEADHYAVFIETLLNPAAPNCSTADPLQINHNLTTQSLHGLVMYVSVYAWYNNYTLFVAAIIGLCAFY